MNFNRDVDLMMIVTKISHGYVQLVREFIINLLEKIVDPQSPDYLKVYIRGRCFEFSPRAINEFIGRVAHVHVGPLPTRLELVKEITCGDPNGWPVKDLLPDVDMSIKYVILYKIGVKN